MAITKYALMRPTISTWRNFDTASNRLARMFDDFAPFTADRNGRWMPAVSVFETSDDLVLTAELPGLTEGDISIDFENSVLTIRGEKTETRIEGDEDRRDHVWERTFGSFSRSFTLPSSVDGAGIAATFDNGVLTVTLPKMAEAKGRKIEIGK